MKITDLKKQLNSMEKDELISLVCKLYKVRKEAQSLINVELCGNFAEESLAADCKKKIQAAFFGSKLSLKNVRTVISDFKKFSKNRENVAELMLFYVECSIEYTSMYGDIDEAFYYSIESMFADFVRALNDFDNETYYKRNADRIKGMCLGTYCVGWEFSEEMMNIYYDIQWLEEED